MCTLHSFQHNTNVHAAHFPTQYLCAHCRLSRTTPCNEDNAHFPAQLLMCKLQNFQDDTNVHTAQFSAHTNVHTSQFPAQYQCAHCTIVSTLPMCTLHIFSTIPIAATLPFLKDMPLIKGFLADFPFSLLVKKII